MKAICLYFQLHQPLQLKRYRFFEIGTDHYYYDDFADEQAIRRLAEKSFLPANKTLLEMIKSSNKKFEVAFSISGIMLEQLEQYAPEVIDSFKELSDTGCVEFLAGTYAHSLSSIYDEAEFKQQVKQQCDKIQILFGKKPTSFCNTDLIYSDEIGNVVSEMGFKGILTEGARHILGWKSPNYLYSHPYNKSIKLMPRNYKLSDDISCRFSNWSWDQYPLTAEKYINWIASTPPEEEIISIGMSYDTIGDINTLDSGIFDFIKALPYYALLNKMSFQTPTEAFAKHKASDFITSNEPISWADEEKDLSAWSGNDLQNEALQKLYAVGERVRLCTDRALQYDWMNLQSCEHFSYMSTKHFTSGASAHFSPYESPYEAFMNYMNILSDFLQRVDEQYPTSIENEELNSLLKTINNQESQIVTLEAEVKKLKSKKEVAPKPESADKKASTPKEAKKYCASKKSK